MKEAALWARLPISPCPASPTLTPALCDCPLAEGPCLSSPPFSALLSSRGLFMWHPSLLLLISPWKLLSSGSPGTCTQGCSCHSQSLLTAATFQLLGPKRCMSFLITFFLCHPHPNCQQLLLALPSRSTQNPTTSHTCSAAQVQPLPPLENLLTGLLASTLDLL